MDQEELESNKEVLRNFLKDTEALDKLESFADRQNIFKILSIEGMEIRHSNFLAWLLDPAANHHLGETFLKKFLFQYAEKSDNAKVDVFDIDRMDFDDALVYRELHHMDIIVESRKSNFILVIENKIYSSEGNNQTKKYRKVIEENYESIGNKFFVYLTLDNTEAEDSQWVSMCYSDLIPLIESVSVRMPSDSPGRLFVENYVEVLKEMAGNEETELQLLCRNIYTEHKKAIDILVKNLPDDFRNRANLIKDLVRSTPNIIYRENSNNSYIRFTTSLILDKIGTIGTDQWTPEKDILLFEIVNNRNGTMRFILTLGPAEDPEKRNILWNYLAGKWKRQSKNSDQWTRVYSKSFKLNEDLDVEEQLKTQIETFVTKTIPEDINPVLEAFRWD